MKNVWDSTPPIAPSLPLSNRLKPHKRSKRKEANVSAEAKKDTKDLQDTYYDPSQCSEIIDHQPETCKHCQAPVTGEDGQPYRHQIVEIPPVAPVVTEHRLHALTCGCCGQTTRAELPDDINSSGYGERLQSLVALLSGAYRLSHNQVQTRLEGLMASAPEYGNRQPHPSTSQSETQPSGE